MKYKIYVFSAQVHLKFRKIERAVISKGCFFRPGVCPEHSATLCQKDNSTSIFCVSEVVSDIQFSFTTVLQTYSSSCLVYFSSCITKTEPWGDREGLVTTQGN